MKNSALVVIDLQNDITKNYKDIIDRVDQAIDWAVGRQMCVIYIQHNNLSAGVKTFKPGTHGADFVPELKVVSDNIFVKSKSSALTCESFVDFIRARSQSSTSIWKRDFGNRRHYDKDTFRLPREYPKKPRKSLLYQ